MVIVAVALLLVDSLSAEAASWQTGKMFRLQLQQPATLETTGSPLRATLMRLAEAQRTAIFLDRRVDPETMIALVVQQRPLEELFDRIAAEAEIGWSVLGDVVYFGPQPSARQLRTLVALRREDARGLPASVRTALAQKRTLKWEQLAEPRVLLEKLVDDFNLELPGKRRLPHDLWPAVDLPSLSGIERMSLLTVGFDLTFRFSGDGSALELVPIPQQVEMVRTYPATSDVAGQLAKMRSLAPEATIQQVDDRIEVRGTVEDFERLQAKEGPRQPRPSLQEGAVEVYTLQVQNKPLRPVLQQLLEKLNLELVMDEAAIQAAGIDLDQQISFDVKNATVEQLLAAVLGPAGLSARLSDQKVQVAPTP